MTTQIHRIAADCQPEFPCWLWGRINAIYPSPVEHWRPHSFMPNAGLHYLPGRPDDKLRPGVFLATHWHPDQPEAPTATPPTEQATEGGVTTERDVRCHVAAVAQGETPRTPPDWAQTPEREVQYWRTLAVDQSRILNRCMEAAGMPGDACGYALWDKITHFQRTISELWKWSENQKSVHERELNEAKARHDRISNQLIGKVLTLRRQLAQVEKERDAARRDYDEKTHDLYNQLTAAESELAELRKDRERLDWLEKNLTHLNQFNKKQKKRWAVNPSANYEYDVFDTLRSAIDAVMQQEGRG